MRRNRLFKTAAAGTMAAMLLFGGVSTGVPLTAFTAQTVAAASTQALKGKVKISSTKALDSKFGLKYTWKKVAGAKYQYRYKLADSADYSKAKNNKGTSVSIDLSNGYENVSFQVRAFKKVNGKKTYTKWTTKTLETSKVDSMLCKALNYEVGYIKGGIVYQGGLYASDAEHSDCDLDIAVFTVGATADGKPCYVIRQGGRIVSYGYFETSTKKLEDGTEYTSITVPADGENGERTFGYCFDEDLASGFVVTEDGVKVKAKPIDVSVGWEMMEETQSGSTASTLPAYQYPGSEVFYSVLYQYIADEFGKNYDAADVGIPCPIILSVDESNPEDILVYGNFCYYNYKLNGDILEMTSGGSYPGVIHMKKTDDGYTATSSEIVADGEDFTESAKKIFGGKYDDFTKLQSDDKEAEKTRAQIIANYVAANNLSITAYQDYGWDPVQLPAENIDSFYSTLN